MNEGKKERRNERKKGRMIDRSGTRVSLSIKREKRERKVGFNNCWWSGRKERERKGGRKRQ